MHEEYQYLLSRSLEEDAMDELNQMIDEEISRPMKKADISRIEQSIRAYMALMGNERELEELKKTGIEKLRAGQRVIHVKRRKRSLVVVAIAAILAIANAITVHASDENIVSFIIHYTEESFSVTPIQETRVITLPTTPDDPYGIKGYCAKYGLTVEAPTYIPEGFHLWAVESYTNSVKKNLHFGLPMVKYIWYLIMLSYMNGMAEWVFPVMNSMWKKFRSMASLPLRPRKMDSIPLFTMMAIWNIFGFLIALTIKNVIKLPNQFSKGAYHEEIIFVRLRHPTERRCFQ